MPINMDNFIFHSGRVPYGSVKTSNISLPIGGVVPTGAPKRILSDTIELPSGSISPSLSYKIPPGTWYELFGPQIPAGSRLIGGGFQYRQSLNPLLTVHITPIVEYVEGGVKIGVSMTVIGSSSVTVPDVSLEFTATFDVIPDNIS